MTRIFGLICLFVCLISCSITPLPDKQSIKQKIHIAVLPASNSEVNQKISEMLTSSLKQSDYFILVEKNKLKKVYKELKFQQSGLVSEKNLLRLGKHIDADFLVSGELVSSSNDESTTSVAIGLTQVTISVKVIDLKKNIITGLCSETGRSVTGGLGYEVRSKTREGVKSNKDLVGVQRSEDDMLNSAIRSAADGIAKSVVKICYTNNGTKYADATPNRNIDKLSSDYPDNNRAIPYAFTFIAPYDTVFSAVTKRYKNKMRISDEKKGVLVSQAYDPGAGSKRIVYAYVKKDVLNTTNLTVKAFCYSLDNRKTGCGSYKVWHNWEQYKGTCWNIWDNPSLCSITEIKHIAKIVEKEAKENDE